MTIGNRSRGRILLFPFIAVAVAIGLVAWTARENQRKSTEAHAAALEMVQQVCGGSASPLLERSDAIVRESLRRELERICEQAGGRPVEVRVGQGDYPGSAQTGDVTIWFSVGGVDRLALRIAHQGDPTMMNVVGYSVP